MKITVNHFRSGLTGFVILAGLVLSGCAPIPQAGPAAIPQQSQPPSVSRPAAQVPQAAPLPKQRAATAQSYAARPVGRPQVRQSARPAVPPTLQPAPRAANNTAKAAKNNSRRRPVAKKRPPPAPPASQKPRKKTPVRPAKKQAPRQPAANKAVIKPAAPPAKPVWETITPAPAQNNSARVEVLEVQRATQPPAAKPVVEKVVPPAPVYKSNPAVTILTKQANNQLMAGKTDRAAATLERALRIAPDDPMLWLRLAEVNEQQGNKAQAASMAKKALGLAPNDASIKQRGSRLIN